MRKRREIEVFSLSFLDCICCGFGAIILLFVLTIGPIKKKLQENQKGVSEYLLELERSLLSTKQENQSLEKIQAQLATTPSLESNLPQLIEELAAQEKAISIASSILDRQEKQLQEYQSIETPKPLTGSATPVGVPTDSTHLLFLIDTSGSMRTLHGLIRAPVIRQIEYTLNAYPQIQGIQLMDSSGNYIIPMTNKTWLPDTPVTRKSLLTALRHYRFTSISNPTPGLIKAFKDFAPPQNPHKKIGIYIFGDEFPATASSVISKLDELNPAQAPHNERVFTINACGFAFGFHPTPHPRHTNYKFAYLMRELTQRHGGAFTVVTH